jgi:hypothetical protein
METALLKAPVDDAVTSTTVQARITKQVQGLTGKQVKAPDQRAGESP